MSSPAASEDIAAAAAPLASHNVDVNTFENEADSIDDVDHEEGNSTQPSEIRKRLPSDLATWRFPGSNEQDEIIWRQLYDFFKARGLTYWEMELPNLQVPPDGRVTSNGFGYASLRRGWGQSSSFEEMQHFSYPTALCRAARATDGRDVVIRVLAMGTKGREHVDILKLISMKHYSTIDNNHAIPLFELIDFEDITFGIFPKIGHGVREAYRLWAKNSVGDVVDMILQCIEALAFLHYVGIAHMDAFKDNFLVQFHPESFARNEVTVTRPRVYVTDFETAVYFPPDVPLDKRACVGPPTAVSWPTDIREYNRPMPPEVLSGEPYDPFKLDVWQLATSLRDFKSTIPAIDDILDEMRNPDPTLRLTSNEALQKLRRVVASIPPASMLIAPVCST